MKPLGWIHICNMGKSYFDIRFNIMYAIFCVVYGILVCPERLHSLLISIEDIKKLILECCRLVLFPVPTQESLVN